MKKKAPPLSSVGCAARSRAYALAVSTKHHLSQRMTRSRKATSAAALAQSLASRDCVLSLARRHPFLPPPLSLPKKCCNTRGPASAGPPLPCNVLMHSTYSQARLPSAKPPSPLASAHSPLLKLSTRLERLPPGQAGFAEPLSPCASMCASTHPQRSRSGPRPKPPQWSYAPDSPQESMSNGLLSHASAVL